MPMAAPVLLPPLRDGDCLSREEFLCRWDAMPDLKFAELIDGVVYVSSPVSLTHGDFHAQIIGFLLQYANATRGCAARLETSWLMSHDSVPQPDAALRILSQYGGQSKVEGNYPSGAPELIVEVSHTTNTKDTGAKLHLYERNGVQEYVIFRPQKQRIAWRALVNGKYQEIERDSDGLFRSRVFPGLWLHPEALWNGDFAELAATVQKGIATAEHAAFVTKLLRSADGMHYRN